jgi:two-component system response regulator PhcR
MGLLFCQRVMQAAGGAIGIESQRGQGTTVTLSFERAIEPPAEDAAGSSQDGGAAPAGSRRTGNA